MDKTLAPDTDLLESVCENDRSVPHMLGGTEITKLPPTLLSKYVGNYEYAPGRPAAITADGDLLFLQEGANPLKLPLAPRSETIFVSRTEGNWIEFMKDAQGAIIAFVYHAGPAERRAARTKQ
jgi:hypothetical protein